MNQLTMVIPTLNEAGNIKILCQQIIEAVPNCKIIVVDDNSNDGTQQEVKNLIQAQWPIELIERNKKPCLTESIELGLNSATTPYVGWMDADLSHPPSLIPELLNQAKIYKCAIATRFAKGGQYKKSSKDSIDSILATILSVIINFLVKRWLNLRVTDFTSGFIVCDRRVLEGHKFVGDYGEYFIEIVYYILQCNVEIFEVPYSSPPRVWGESKTGPNLRVLIARGIKYLWISIRLRLSKRVFGKLSLQQKTRNLF